MEFGGPQIANRRDLPGGFLVPVGWMERPDIRRNKSPSVATGSALVRRDLDERRRLRPDPLRMAHVGRSKVCSGGRWALIVSLR